MSPADIFPCLCNNVAVVIGDGAPRGCACLSTSKRTELGASTLCDQGIAENLLRREEAPGGLLSCGDFSSEVQMSSKPLPVSMRCSEEIFPGSVMSQPAPLEALEPVRRL